MKYQHYVFRNTLYWNPNITNNIFTSNNASNILHVTSVLESAVHLNSKVS